MTKLTIAMPVYNEEASIAGCVADALATLDRLGEPGEVLVVDDGSTDSTPGILSRLSEEDSRVRVHRNERNGGIGVFNRQLVDLARGDWVFFISADGEFDVAEALRFLDAAARENYDAVLGYRVNKRYTAYRAAVSWMFNWLVLVCFGTRFRDIGSIRLLRREIFAPIRLHCQSAFLNAERLLVARHNGARIKELPVRHYPRASGKGGGSRLGKVARAVGDLICARLRWFRFNRYYGPAD